MAMALRQKLSLFLAAALALVLTVACQHQGFLLRMPTPTTTTQTQPLVGPTDDDVPDAGPGELPDDDAAPQVGEVALKKPVWQKHFVVELNYRGPIVADGAKVVA